MFRYVFLIILFLHALVHLAGFAKAFRPGSLQAISAGISKPMGILWLVAALLLMATGIFLSMKQSAWWMAGLLAITLSQILLLTVWQDGKYGTVANLLLLLGIVAGFGQWRFEKSFYGDVAIGLKQTGISHGDVVTETDLQRLPAPVQRYLRYVGVVNKPKVKNMRLVFEGRMRDKGKDWFPLRSVQYNFYDLPERLFFMKGYLFGVDVPGYHRYSRGVATMDIKLFGLFPIVANKGSELNKAETVTLLNDMCFLAPATLIDPRIKWVATNDSSAKAIFTCNGITVSAILKFNAQDQLVNFISSDRYAIGDMKRYEFSTPVKDYKNVEGCNLPTFAQAIWHYPDGPFVYGEFRLKEVAYNIHNIEK